MTYSYYVTSALKVLDDVDLLNKSGLSNYQYAFIIDLEDTVPSQRKAEARGILCQLVKSNVLQNLQESHPLFFKPNHPSTSFYQEDLELLRFLAKQLPGMGIVMSKTESAQEILDILNDLNCHSVEIIAGFETILGYRNREEILQCAAKNGLKKYIIGAGDMSRELQIRRDYSLGLLNHIFYQIIATGRSCNLGFIDSPSRSLPSKENWLQDVYNESIWSFCNGAVAKIALHPLQIPVIEQVFNGRLERNLTNEPK